jgi:hypothetical protein
MRIKSIFESRTAALSLVTALMGLWPAGAQFVADNPQACLVALGLISLGLRYITEDRVRLFPKH